MPKLPRDVSHDRIVRFLRRRGWMVVEGARHTLLVKDTSEVTIPRHTKLRTGTVAQILKAAEVSPAEWSDL